MSDATKRMNYFDRQFLRAADFEDEQAYNLDRRRRQNRFLHTPGVADGLTAKGNPGDSFVTVSAGTAYDSQGNDIVLASQQQVPLPSGVTGIVLIVIAYSEQSTNPSTDPGVTGNATRISEIPSLTATALPAPPNSLPLAQVTLKNGTVDGSVLNNPNNNVRTQAGCLVSDDITVSNLTLKNATIPPAQWPTLSCDQANEVALPALDVSSGDIRWGNSSRLSVDQGGSIELGADDTRAGTGTPYIDFHFNGLKEDFNARIINDANGRLTVATKQIGLQGNVGIGAVSPQTKLHINTLTSVDEGTTAAGAWANFGSNAHFDGAWKRIDGTKAGVNFHMNADDGAGQEFRFLRVEADGTKQRNLAVIGSKVTCILESNVGIGTATPAEPLEVNGRVKSGALSVGPWPPNPGGYVFVGTNALDQTNAANYALLQGSGAETGVTFLNSPQQINFRIGNIDKMRLLKDGTIQWGNNSQVQPDQGGSIELGGNNGLAGSGTPYIDFHFGNGRVEDFNARIINNAEGVLTLQVPNLVASGNALKPGGGSWGSVSDVKLKKNIRPLVAALDKLLKLRGVSYEWKEPEKHANLSGAQMGLIAQEVEEVFPEWVGTDANGRKTVTVRGFEALTIEALRELKAENEALKVKYKELEAKIQTPGKEPKSKA